MLNYYFEPYYRDRLTWIRNSLAGHPLPLLCNFDHNPYYSTKIKITNYPRTWNLFTIFADINKSVARKARIMHTFECTYIYPREGLSRKGEGGGWEGKRGGTGILATILFLRVIQRLGRSGSRKNSRHNILEGSRGTLVQVQASIVPSRRGHVPMRDTFTLRCPRFHCPLLSLYLSLSLSRPLVSARIHLRFLVGRGGHRLRFHFNRVSFNVYQPGPVLLESRNHEIEIEFHMLARFHGFFFFFFFF